MVNEFIWIPVKKYINKKITHSDQLFVKVGMCYFNIKYLKIYYLSDFILFNGHSDVFSLSHNMLKNN